MAQSGFTPISLYYSTTASAAPTAGNLVNGELAINIRDGKLYYKDNTGAVQLLASKSAATGPAGSNTQIQFNSSGNFGASANLTWNGTTLGVTGALTASADSSFTSTGALLISKGTALQQPGSPATGMIRYNTTSNEFEGYSGSVPAWKSIGGSALSNDTTTATNLYPVFAAATRRSDGIDGEILNEPHIETSVAIDSSDDALREELGQEWILSDGEASYGNRYDDVFHHVIEAGGAVHG